MDANAARGLRDRRLPLARRRAARRGRARAHAGPGQGGRRPLSALRQRRARRRRRPRRGARRRATACPGWSPSGCSSTASASRPATWSGSAPRISASPTRSTPRPTPPRACFSLRPAGDRAPRRPRGQRPPDRGLAVRFVLPAAARRPRPTSTALRDEARARFGDTGLQWRDRRSGPPGVGRFVDRLGSFLVLSGSPASRWAASASPRRCARTSRPRPRRSPR